MNGLSFNPSVVCERLYMMPGFIELYYVPIGISLPKAGFADHETLSTKIAT